MQKCKCLKFEEPAKLKARPQLVYSLREVPLMFLRISLGADSRHEDLRLEPHTAPRLP